VETIVGRIFFFLKPRLCMSSSTLKPSGRVWLRDGIIEPLGEQSTKWVSSCLPVDKPDGSLHITMDPRDLNKAILRSQLLIPTIEEVATNLNKARIFTVIDAGLWHIMLDNESSTMNTPFGRYRWKRLVMDLNSAPEIFQRRMNEVIERLKGVFVIADDILVVGFGDNDE